GGDARAREWLSKILIGDNPAELLKLVEEVDGLKQIIKGQQHGNGNAQGADAGSASIADDAPLDEPTIGRIGPQPVGGDDAGELPPRPMATRRVGGPCDTDVTALF